MNERICITFTNTIEDMIAFNVYHFATSPTLRRTKFWHTWGFIMVFSALGGLLSIINRSLGPLIFGVVWSSLFALLAVFWYRRAIPRQVRKLYSEGKNKGVLGPHTLRIDEDGLHETSEVSEGKTLWSGIERIGEDDDYLFVYVQAMMAHVIPKHRIDAGDLQALTDELRRRVGQSE